MADDGDSGIVALDIAGGELVEQRPEIRLDVGAVYVKGDIARNVELEPVVRRLRHLHAGALRGLLHLPLLLFHAPGPDIPDRRAGRAAEDGAGRGAAALAVTGDVAQP